MTKRKGFWGWRNLIAPRSVPAQASAALDLPRHGAADLNRLPLYSIQVNWGIQNEARFNELVAELLTLVAPGYYFGDNLITWFRNISFLEDPRFREALTANVQNTSDSAIAWRRYILACAAYHCVQLDGDFVECGVYLATGIKTVVDYLGGKQFPKQFYGYDTFDYNPVEGHSFAGQAAGLYEKVKQRFEGYEQVHLIQGLIPQSFETACPERIAYLHIDLNSAEYEIAVLEELFDRLIPGAIIIFDDYEWSGVYRPQKIAEDAWLEKYNYHVFPLPTGQGLVFIRP